MYNCDKLFNTYPELTREKNKKVRPSRKIDFQKNKYS